jgi:hypothetical protein
MKTIKILFFAALMLILFTSCTCDDDTIIVNSSCELTKTEEVLYDSQDNLIRLNNVWLHNLDMGTTPWSRLQYIGIDQSIGLGSLRITSEKEILEVYNPSFYGDYTLTFVSPYEVIFYSRRLQAYYDNNDVYYFVIKTKI